MKCTDVSEQIVDYLYEEMGLDERRAFAAHVASCAACRTEVEGMRATLGLARATLAANDEPVPAQVHATAAALVGVAVRTGTGALRPVGAPVIAENAGGLWSWLRKPWFFPAFAAAAVISLFFLARETLLPTAELAGGTFTEDVRHKGAAAESVGEGAPTAAAPAAEPVGAVPAAPPVAPAPASAPSEALQPPAAAAAANRFVADDESVGRPEGRGAGDDRPAKKREALADRDVTGAAGAIAGQSPARTRGEADLAGARPAGAMRAPTSVPIAAPYARAREQRRDPRGAFPEATAAKEMAPAEATLAEAPTLETAEESEELESAAVRKGGPPPVARNEVAAATKGGVGGVVRPAPAPSARARAFADGETGSATSPADVTNQAALIDLGKRLYAEGRMADAAAVYRDLIKRFPSHPDVSVWKTRLDQATAVVNETRMQAAKGPAAATAAPAKSMPAKRAGSKSTAPDPLGQ